MKSTRFLATTVCALAIMAASLAPWETPVNHGSNPHVTNSRLGRETDYEPTVILFRNWAGATAWASRKRAVRWLWLENPHSEAI